VDQCLRPAAVNRNVFDSAAWALLTSILMRLAKETAPGHILLGMLLVLHFHRSALAHVIWTLGVMEPLKVPLFVLPDDVRTMADLNGRISSYVVQSYWTYLRQLCDQTPSSAPDALFETFVQRFRQIRARYSITGTRGESLTPPCAILFELMALLYLSFATLQARVTRAAVLAVMETLIQPASERPLLLLNACSRAPRIVDALSSDSADKAVQLDHLLEEFCLFYLAIGEETAGASLGERCLPDRRERAGACTPAMIECFEQFCMLCRDGFEEAREPRRMVHLSVGCAVSMLLGLLMQAGARAAVVAVMRRALSADGHPKRQLPPYLVPDQASVGRRSSVVEFVGEGGGGKRGGVQSLHNSSFPRRPLLRSQPSRASKTSSSRPSWARRRSASGLQMRSRHG